MVTQSNTSSALNEKIFTEVKDLARAQKVLYQELNILQSKDSLSVEETAKKKILLERLKQMSQLKVTLVDSLPEKYKWALQNVAATRSDLVDKLTTIDVMNRESENINNTIEELKDIRNNKLRMAEINTYYALKYDSYIGFVKLFTLVSVVILLITILRKKGILPENVANILLGIVALVGGYFILVKGSDLYWRDNMSYQEYDWMFSGATAKNKTVFENNKNALEGTAFLDKLQTGGDKIASMFGSECQGEKCCGDGSAWDAKAGKCGPGKPVEGFDQLRRYGPV